MSISSELLTLNNTKQAIKASINAKGGNITNSTPFADYSTAIDNLPTGGSGNPVLESIDVSDFSGTTFNTAKNYITGVTIPSGVTSIGNAALQYLSITSLTIPDSVTSISSASIANCQSLTSLTIGTGLRTVNYTAFEHCDNLTSVYYRGSLADWCGIDFGTYNYGSATLGQPLYNNANSRLYINNTAITGELTIPNTVTTLANGCFSGYKAITSVIIPDNVTTINGQVFGGCTNLTKINVGSGVTSIGSKAFYYCTGLTALIFNSATPPTLANTEALNNTNNCPIYVPAESVAAYKAATNWSTYESRIYPIQQVATVDGNPVYNYELGMTSTDTITSENMAKMPSGTSVEFAEGLTNIAAGEINYQEVILPSTFTGFGDSDMIGSSVTTITSNAVTPPSAFRNQLGGSGLTAIYVPASAVDTYKAHAAWGTFSSIIQAIPSPLMAEITKADSSVYEIPYDGVGLLDENNVPFEDALVEATDIHITSYATAIGQPYELDGAYYGVFEGDGGATNTLKTVTIDEGLTAIPNQAFASNVGLTTVTLPSTITSIGDYAFGMSDGSGPLGLISVTIHATTPPTLGTNAIGVRTSSRPGAPHGRIYVPASAVDTYKAATGWSTWAQYIEAIPSE